MSGTDIIMADRKAQVQAISMVLIAGIVLALAGAAYFWGKPLIEKRSTITDVNTAKSFILDLDRQITEVSRNGGEKSLKIPAIPGASFKVDELNNGVLFRFVSSQQLMEMGEGSTAIPVETYDDSPVGDYGDSPRRIYLTGEPVENNQFLLAVNMTYRQLNAENPPRGYIIRLSDGGNLAGNSAPSRVIVKFEGYGYHTDSGGRDITETLVNVTLA